MGTEMALDASPAANVNVPETAVKSAAVAVPNSEA